MRLSSLALAAALALSAGGASLAQPAPAPAPGPVSGGHAWTRPDPQQMAERLGAILQLRPDQQPALRAYAEALRSAAEPLERRKAERAEARGLSTPERLDRLQQRMAEHHAAMTAAIEATRRFYAQLDPAQKRAFDALPTPMLHDHHMKMGPGGPHAHGMGGPEAMPPGPPPGQ